MPEICQPRRLAFEREKDFTVTSHFLSTGSGNFRCFSSLTDRRRDFRLTLALGDEGYHSKSPTQRQQPR